MAQCSAPVKWGLDTDKFVLEQALESGWIQEALKGLVPPQPGYGKLKRALKLYREIAAKGAWPEVKGEAKLEIGLRWVWVLCAGRTPFGRVPPVAICRLDN